MDFTAWATAVGAEIDRQLASHVTSTFGSATAEWTGPVNRAIATPHADGTHVVIRYARGPQDTIEPEPVAEAAGTIVERLTLGA